MPDPIARQIADKLYGGAEEKGRRVTIEVTVLADYPSAVEYVKKTLLADVPEDIELDDVWLTEE